MKGARALASGMLVLAAVCAAPGISAAQEQDQVTTTTTPSDPAPDPTVPAATDPAVPSTAEPSAGGGTNGGASKPDQAQAPPATAAPTSREKTARSSSSVTVSMGDFFFSPTSVSISVGDTVTWRNNGQAPHNATADDGSFRTPDLGNGQSASHTFNSPGTFAYICTIHPNMKGTVRVLSSSGGSGGSSGTSSSPGISESAATASPNAAGSSSTLPMTGVAAGAMALVGFALLGAGLLLRHANGGRGAELPPVD